jgi:hypothetical protein
MTFPPPLVEVLPSCFCAPIKQFVCHFHRTLFHCAPRQPIHGHLAPSSLFPPSCPSKIASVVREHSMQGGRLSDGKQPHLLAHDHPHIDRSGFLSSSNPVLPSNAEQLQDKFFLLKWDTRQLVQCRYLSLFSSAKPYYTNYTLANIHVHIPQSVLIRLRVSMISYLHTLLYTNVHTDSPIIRL